MTRCTINLPVRRITTVDGGAGPGSGSQVSTGHLPSGECVEMVSGDVEAADKSSSSGTPHRLSGDTPERARKQLALFLDKEGILIGVGAGPQNSMEKRDPDPHTPEAGRTGHSCSATPTETSALTGSSESDIDLPRKDDKGARAAYPPCSGLTCVVVEGEPSQRDVYKAILPGLVGGESKIIILGAIETEIITILRYPQRLTEMVPPPDLIILDFLLDYSSQGWNPTGPCGS